MWILMWKNMIPLQHTTFQGFQAILRCAISFFSFSLFHSLANFFLWFQFILRSYFPIHIYAHTFLLFEIVLTILLIVYNIFWFFVVRGFFNFALFIVLFLSIYWFRWIFEIRELWYLYPLIEARLSCWQEQALSSSLWHQHQWCSRCNNPPGGTKESPRDTPSNMAGGDGRDDWGTVLRRLEARLWLATRCTSPRR